MQILIFFAYYEPLLALIVHSPQKLSGQLFGSYLKRTEVRFLTHTVSVQTFILKAWSHVGRQTRWLAAVLAD